MTLEDYEKWKGGWVDGLFLAGTIIQGYLNLDDKDLRKGLKNAIKLLQELKEKEQEIN